MSDIYEKCPVLTGKKINLMKCTEADVEGLLECYSDKAAVPFFNSDNCDGDDFYYSTIEKMKKGIDFWVFAYKNRYFVRMTVRDNKTNEILGTIEAFHRDSDDYFNGCCLLRIDLKSSAEKEEIVSDILTICSDNFYTFFNTDRIVTKAIPLATERIKALTKCGYSLSTHKIAHKFGDYWEVRK